MGDSVWTLAPGLILYHFPYSGPCLTDIVHRTAHALGDDEAALFGELSLGVAQDAVSPDIDAFGHRGWIVRQGGCMDPELAARLRCLADVHGERLPESLQSDHELVVGAHASRRCLYPWQVHRSALPETVVRSAHLLAGGHQRVLVIGDPDLLSIAVHGRGHTAVVMETHPYVRRLLCRLAAGAPGLQILSQDAREPLPRRLRGTFDAFFADPLATRGRLGVTLARGLCGLKPGGHGFVCVPPAEVGRLEELCQRMRAPIEKRCERFAAYYEVPNCTRVCEHVADLLVLRRDAATAPVPAPEMPCYPPDFDGVAGAPQPNGLACEWEVSNGCLLSKKALVRVAAAMDVTWRSVPGLRRLWTQGPLHHYERSFADGASLQVALDASKSRVCVRSSAGLEKQLQSAVTQLVRHLGEVPVRGRRLSTWSNGHTLTADLVRCGHET